MKLSEKDLQDACQYIMDEATKAAYGVNYKESGFSFNMRSMPITVREIVALFIEWLKMKKDERDSQKIIV